MWYYVEGGSQKGPVSEADLVALAASGVINNTTLVWREGMATWQAYQTLTAPVAAAGGPPIAGGVVCSECRRIFPPSEVIRQGDQYICAECKPIYLQKIKEGVTFTPTMDYAGFGIRGGSVILDGIIMYVVNTVTSVVLIKIIGPAGVWAGLVTNLLFNFSYMVFFIGKYGATPGKMANRLVVVNPDGSPIGYGKATGRYFATLLSGLVFCIGYLMVLGDPERRALHDRICGTRVIRKPKLVQ